MSTTHDAAAITERLQSVAEITFNRLSVERFHRNMNARIIVRWDLSLRHAVVVRCGSPPTIHLSARVLLDALESGNGKRFRRIAIATLRILPNFTSRLSLIPAVEAVAFSEERQKWRKVVANAYPDWSLPERYFSTTLSVTVRDELSGETVSVDGIRPAGLAHAERDLRAALSRRMLLDTETSRLVDAIEQVRNHVPESHPTEGVITDRNEETHTAISYE